MPNTYFKFKQFTINQEHCAMKVCTDACIQVRGFRTKIAQHARVLDIGAGNRVVDDDARTTLPGRYPRHRDRWGSLSATAGEHRPERLETTPAGIPGDARSFQFPHPYDFIISNPPFFESDWLSANDREQIAKHSTCLRSMNCCRLLPPTCNRRANLVSCCRIIAGSISINWPTNTILPFRRN